MYLYVEYSNFGFAQIRTQDANDASMQAVEQLTRQMPRLEPFEALFSESNDAQTPRKKRVINDGPEDLSLRYLSWSRLLTKRMAMCSITTKGLGCQLILTTGPNLRRIITDPVGNVKSDYPGKARE